MVGKELHALLIAGDESRFANGLAKFRRFLFDDVGLNPHNERTILCTYMGNDYLLEETRLFFDRLPKGSVYNVVILYHGHGGKGRFFPNDSSLSYEEWGRLVSSNGNFIYINDSCYSGSAIDSFERIGLLPEKGMVIASSRSHELSYGNVFLSHLIENYQNRRTFRRRVIGNGTSEGYFTVKPSRRKLETKLVEGKSITFEYIPETWHYIRYKRPKILKPQHPVRSGKSLDHLLFKR